MTIHDGKRSTLWSCERDGGALLARIEERGAVYYWGLGNDTPTRRCESLYGAQRAVRKALREQAQS